MSASTFKINKLCEDCGKLFQAQKVTTRFCSKNCAGRNYKLRKKLEMKRLVEENTAAQLNGKIAANAVTLEVLKEKQILNVKEVASLLRCTERTVRRLISKGQIPALKLGERTTRIRFDSIEGLFLQQEHKADEIENEKPLKVEDCYGLAEIIEKFNVSDTGLRTMAQRHKIPKLVKHPFTYYEKKAIEKLFNPLT